MTEDEWDQGWARFLAAHDTPAPPPRAALLRPSDVAVPLAAVGILQAVVVALAWLG